VDKFLTILAWILAVPTTLFVSWCLFTLIVVFFSKDARLEIGVRAIVPYIIFALSWAWILSK
jgi:hypothetical protein